MSISVVIAEDNSLLRQGIGGLLASSAELEVVASVPDLPQLMTAIDAHDPDVVLTDIRMPPTHTDEGIKVARYCRRHHPRTGVLLLSQYVDPAYVKELLDGGTEGRGYLLKERVADVDELVAGVRAVADGGSVVDPKVVQALVSSRSGAVGSELERLTPRERAVLGEMAHGHNNQAIAADLVITQRAVEKHINSIFAKLGVSPEDGDHPRVRAVLLYLAEGVR